MNLATLLKRTSFFVVSKQRASMQEKKQDRERSHQGAQSFEL